MASKLRLLGLIILTLAIASVVSVYSYGRFAKRVQGPASYAYPLQRDQTLLE